MVDEDVTTSAGQNVPAETQEPVRLIEIRAKLLAIELELTQLRALHAELLSQATRFNAVLIDNEVKRSELIENELASHEHWKANRATLRDSIAVSAMNGLLSSDGAQSMNASEVARWAYQQADAMLAARGGT